MGTRIQVWPRPRPQTGRSRWLRLVGAVALAASLSGCGLTVGPTGDDTTKLHDQAQAALARWAAGVAAAGGNDAFVQIGDRTLQIGDWEEAVGGDDKIAMLDGLVDSTIPLSDEPPPDGQVNWPDGSASTVGLVSAAQVLRALKSEGDPSSCSGCKPLEITKAELSERPVTTSRGTAQTPVWLFSLQGACTAVGAPRTATAELAEPLGNRAVLEVQQGLPVAVSLSP